MKVLASFHLRRIPLFARRIAAVRGPTGSGSERWELAIVDVAAEREVRVVALPLAATADLLWMAVTPDDSRIIVSAGMNASDIWLLERFEPPSSPLARFLRW